MDDRVDSLADEWEPHYRAAFEYTSELLDEYHPWVLETVSPVVSKCYPVLFGTVADAVEGTVDPGPDDGNGASLDDIETFAAVRGDSDESDSPARLRIRRERALDDLEAADPESRRAAARTLLELAREQPHLFERLGVRSPIVEHRHDEAVRPLLHGVLHQISEADVERNGEQPDRTTDLTSDDDQRRRIAAAAYAHEGRGRYSEREFEIDALVDLVTDHTAGVGARSQAARALSYRATRSNYRPRPTKIVPSLLELAGEGDVDGRSAAAKLLTETVFHNPDAFDEETLDAVTETVVDAISDEDYRVRMRALSPLCEYRDYEAVLGDRIVTIGEAVAMARDDSHPAVAERAAMAWGELPVTESDVSADAVSAGDPDSDASIEERVKALDEDDPEKLAANWATIAGGFGDRDASLHAASRAKALALANPKPILGDDGAISMLAEHVADGYWGNEDAAVALGAAIIADPSVADRETALRVLGRLGYVSTYAGGRLPGRGWTALGVAAGATAADAEDDAVRRVRTYVDHLDVDPVDFLVALYNEDRDGIATVAADARDRIGTTEGTAARAVIALADIDPALWGDALPAAVRALERCDTDDSVGSLATIRSVAADEPERVEAIADELLALVLDPHPDIRAHAAWSCWHVGRAGTSDPDAAVAALAAYDEDDAERQPLWPAGALAREEPKRVESAVLEAVENRLDEKSDRTDGEHLGSLLAEVHAGDPDVGRPAVERLLETIDDEYPELSSGTSLRADVSAALAAVADRYADAIVEAVEGIATVALSANWSSTRGMRNAVRTLDALVEENHDDAVYAALRTHIPRGGQAERDSHSGYVRRHGYFVDESDQIADMYLDAALAERAADRERLETGSRALLDRVSTDTLTDLSDEEIRSLVPELAGRLQGEDEYGDGKLETLAESRPALVAAHVDVVGDLLDDYWGGPRTVGATVARTLAGHDPDAVRPIAMQLAGRVADEDDEYILRASADALRRLAGEDAGLVADALSDRFDHYSTHADAPAEVLSRCAAFDGEQPPTSQIVLDCFEAAGIDPD